MLLFEFIGQQIALIGLNIMFLGEIVFMDWNFYRANLKTIWDWQLHPRKFWCPWVYGLPLPLSGNGNEIGFGSFTECLYNTFIIKNNLVGFLEVCVGRQWLSITINLRAITGNDFTSTVIPALIGQEMLMANNH